ncbi:hypothetical protein SAMN05421747_102316 [Parapedobacter composti]|uniref:Uncharacterized protein n=2 Tax=Parapedobacter composti TaxID=623281 RepID=A0A1I1F8F9_9SPHI|nr:hypothetical protein SAMN05421747_102316 [Parapedobacter composti]
MHSTIKVKLNLLVALFTAAALCANGQVSQPEITTKLWEAIGGQDNWQQARYFMFSCTGGQKGSFVQGERRYLWDKQTGNCRFEGVTTDDETVIALFNIRTHEGTAYINGVQLNNPRVTEDIIKEAAEEFKRDAYLLFLPTALDGDQVSVKVGDEKLVGTQRFTMVNIKNPKTVFSASVAGQLYVDAQTGQIQKWRPNGSSNEFSVDGFKDIGGGLVLPTRFISSDTSASVTYPLAAALVNIEDQKFERP